MKNAWQWSLKLFVLVLLQTVFVAASASAEDQNGILHWDNADWPDDGSAQIPLGNGDVTAGVWVSSVTGDLRVLVGSSSAFDENSQPVHHGLLRIRLDPPLLLHPAAKQQPFFRQTFQPTSASLLLQTKVYSIRIYVDAHAPLLRVSIDSEQTLFAAEASLEPYRRFEKSKLGYSPCHQNYDHYDTVLSTSDLPVELKDTVTWYHENPRNTTLFEETMRKQGVDTTTSGPYSHLTDPFKGRIFGGSLYGSNMKKSLSDNHKILGSELESATIQIALHTAFPSDPKTWVGGMASVVASNPVADGEEAGRRHAKFWEQLWGRSFVTLSARNESKQEMVDLLNSHIIWDRYLALIQGRQAESPIKFNGQAFLANNTGNGWDYRAWGAGYWWQNTRQPYYNCFTQGDFDLLDTLFRFYHQMLPYCQARTYAQFRYTNRPLPKDACFYPETTTAFGTYLMSDWGCDAPVSPFGASNNPFIRFHWTGSLELCLMILDRFEWTADRVALRRHFPIIQSVLSAFMNRYPVGINGAVDIFPSQSLETWQCHDPSNRSNCVTNPTPDVAGLTAVLTRAIVLPGGIASKDQKKVWNAYLKALPELPLHTLDSGKTILMPGELLPSNAGNSENTELYTVHPFRLFGVGKENLELAQATYRQRRFPCNNGWCEDIIDAAMLNFTDDLVRALEDRISSGPAQGFRFPGFAGGFQDYEPSLDHFSTLRTAINYMLLSPLDDGSGRVVLFPGFPSDVWNARFKLHGPNNTLIEAACTNGEVAYVHIEPPEEAWRVKDTGNCRVTSMTIGVPLEAAL